MKKNKKKRIFEYIGALGLLVVTFLLASYHFYFGNKRNAPAVEEECISLCKDALSKGMNLSSGPCLADPMKSYPDWVCDVAHWPREPIDNDPRNQCSSYGKIAHHFVEVTPECEFIRMH